MQETPAEKLKRIKEEAAELKTTYEKVQLALNLLVIEKAKQQNELQKRVSSHTVWIIASFILILFKDQIVAIFSYIFKILSALVADYLGLYKQIGPDAKLTLVNSIFLFFLYQVVYKYFFKRGKK